ncbi:hypothetical protein RZ70_04980 [Apilactobacillus kunkeei]|uniref:hypothetical protein n=1 Tax=Apilactobacillus kunkeei TaxID=148814 RepID=UPI0006C52F38|nr:hypothetical protein [Apilactobacillus kunkeei]KOY76062.1 hypothetical protein RZ70_04980 [Apilactobacillus kunkeei]
MNGDGTGGNILDIHVYTPKHILTITYVDQNGKTVYVEKHSVTDFGTTDASRYLSDNYTIDNNQRFISNYDKDDTVRVTAKTGVDDSVQQNENDFIGDIPKVNFVNSPDDMSTYFGDVYKYNANITLQDQTGKNVQSAVLSSDITNIVKMSQVTYGGLGRYYDLSKLPKYVNLSFGNQVFTVNDSRVGQSDNGESNKPLGNNNKIVFKLIDQNGKFVEYKTFDTYGKRFETQTLKDSLAKEGMITSLNSGLNNEFIPDGTYNMDVPVVVPYKVDKVNYVNQDNQLIFSSYHILSGNDKFDISSDFENLPKGALVDYAKYEYVPDKPEQTVYVTEDLKKTPYQRLSDIEPDTFSQDTEEYNLDLAKADKSGISFMGYSALIVLKDQYGRIVREDSLLGFDNNIVKLNYLSDEIKADYDISSLPKYVDLSKGMQTFAIKSLKPDDTPVTPTKTSGQQVNQNVNKHNEKQSNGISKPTKAQLASITKSFNKDKRAIKADTAKLKALKKKMKKHATKKQKAAYKALQIKLAADKKAVKSYKAQEGKLTKYFKEVSIINRDKKQIKSLTAQMKKLKKKHSKANKKNASKVQKALNKANKSLKAATKFVKNYK